MACVSDMTKFNCELNKLNKDTLVEILLKGCVPVRISVSESLRGFIEKQFDTGNEISLDKYDVNLKKVVETEQLKSDLRVANVENKALLRLVTELETNINQKSTIIHLLSQSKKFTDNIPIEGNVADAAQKYDQMRE
ncbi:hypothetical protein WA026_019547 [Henosepilachna vigintioctopunctata]|uniref:Uncharacterized protein n=1 Tax=Henosepilachna vigintioctopunctata TaxID=420089 RepID=A0AAW1TY34_9CUCU